jgi:hypothetical protein
MAAGLDRRKRNSPLRCSAGLLLAALLGVPVCLAAQQAGVDADALSREATDPTASLMSFNFLAEQITSFHGPSVPGEPDDRTTLTFRPVVPYELFGVPNILRLTMPYQVAGRGEEELKDVTLFNLSVVNQSWGRWGFGPVMTFGTSDAAPDDFAIGPAVGGVWQVDKRLNLGLFSQNVFADDTSISQLQPIAAYQLGQGWSLSLGDLQAVYDWKQNKLVSLPIGAQLGKVTSIASQPMRFAINPQYNLKDDDGLEQFSVTATVTFLIPSP